MKIIELRNISKTYHLDKIDIPAIRDISLDINSGEFVAIMGASGSGKSTLLHIMGLLDKPSGGTYKLAGKEISKLTDDELAILRNRFIGFVFQNFNLLSRISAKENVSLPLIYSTTKKLVDEITILEKVGLGDRINHKPNELSGGQQQRVAIARALINNPLIILADEPTGNLDSKSAFEIMNILKSLNDTGITIVMVTHEYDIAEYAKRIVKLQDGRIVSDEIKIKDSERLVNIEYVNTSLTYKSNILKLRSMYNYFSQALRSLLSNKTRSVLSILGVLIGVTSVIAMIALGTGAGEDVKKRISSLGSNLLVIRPTSPRLGGIALEQGTVTRFTLEDVAEIRAKIPYIDKVSASVVSRGQVVYNGKNWNTSIEGTTEDYPYIRNAKPQLGRFFTEFETITRKKVAVIGQTVVRELFGTQNPLGEFIRINRIDFQVIGVLPVKGSSGWRDEDDVIVIPLNTAMYRLLGKEYVDSINVQVSDINMMDYVSEKIRKLIVSLHRLPSSKADTIDIRNMADVQETITSTVKTFSFLLGSIAFISLLVGGIGIMNIMLVSVTERTREIGLRKAIGASNRDILIQFIIESIVICVLGGIMGIVLGSIISISLSKFAGWSTKISVFSVILSFSFSVMIGLIFGIWPAKKAAELNPIDALRYE